MEAVLISEHGQPVNPGRWTIRRANETDAAVLGALHVRAWQWAYRRLLPDDYLDHLTRQIPHRAAMWRRHLQEGHPERPVWVAERESAIIGFCNTVPAADQPASTAELQTLYLTPEVVGTGVGAALMRCTLDDLRAHGYRAAVLWVLDTNARARRFYEKGGWQADGTEKTEQLWGITVREVRYRITFAESGA